MTNAVVISKPGDASGHMVEKEYVLNVILYLGNVTVHHYSVWNERRLVYEYLFQSTHVNLKRKDMK